MTDDPITLAEQRIRAFLSFIDENTILTSDLLFSYRGTELRISDLKTLLGEEKRIEPALQLAECLISIRGHHPLHTNSDICPICLALDHSDLEFEEILKSRETLHVMEEQIDG